MKNKLKMTGLALVVMLVGCATALPPQPIENFDKTGAGDIFALVFFNSRVSGESVCAKALEANPNLKDKRCDAPGAYYGVIASPQFGAWVSHGFPVLVPNNVDVSGNYIIKVRLANAEPAHFMFVANPGKGDKNSDCYINGSFGPGTGGSGGVVCPKYNWDYRNYVPHP